MDGKSIFDVEVAVNDRNIPLNDFTERLIAGTVHGMLSALKRMPEGEDIEKIEIVIKKGRK